MPPLRSTRSIAHPAPPQTNDPVLEAYINRLHRVLVESFTAVFDDLEQGYSRRTIRATAPVLADLEEGQAILVDGGGLLRVYYRINNVLRYANLT